MGLQDFNTNRDHAIGDVKSRKNLDNLTMEVEAWEALIAQAGGVFPAHTVEGFTDEELKCLIKFYDSEIDSEDYFGCDKGDVKDAREDLVDVLKERKEESEEEEAEAVEAAE